MLEQQEFLSQLDFSLPQEYGTYLFTSESLYDSATVYLIKPAELITYNAAYEAAECYPGYFLIGSDGGGEAIAIEKVTGFFVVTPFIGHDEATPIIIGRTWTEAFRRIQTGNLVGDGLPPSD